MDGESILVWAGISQIACAAFVSVLVYANRKGREDKSTEASLTSLAKDIAALDKNIHRIGEVVAGMPTKHMMENLELRLRLELKTTEATIAAAAAAARHEP